MDRPVRVHISKIGLDGHDRGAKLIVRNLRDAGMEVIYTGLWQTPLSTVYAALQEDVDIIGVSLLSAAHMTIMPEVQRLCREFGIPDVPLIVGGIIPESDGNALREQGIAGVFNPGTPTATIIETLRRFAAERRARQAGSGRPALNQPAGLARALTMVVDGKLGDLGALPKPAHAALRVGVTGAPGVGKSTFIGKLARVLRSRNHRVAVIAVDPTSPLTGGSVLGDRLRMMSQQPDDGLFVRSLSSAGQSGGLGPHCSEVADVLESAGFPIILMETVGAGQNDVEIRKHASEVLLLMMPSAGDTIQFSKAGVVEIATAFVINKADLTGADRTAKELRESLEDSRPIWRVSALRSEGLEPICEWIEMRLAR